jgi:long-chain fatty acid transport protein
VIILKPKFDKSRWVPVLALAGCLALAPAAFPSAFSVNENGVVAQGMGGAFVSVADNATALFFNPAGIAFQDGANFNMDSLVVVGLFRFTPSSTPPGYVVPPDGYSGSIKPHLIPIASLYFTKRLNEKWSIGFGAFAPFGLSTNWVNFHDADPATTKFVGRFAGDRAALQSYWFQPTVGYKINDSNSIGLGVAYTHTHLFLQEGILNPYAKPDDFGRSLAILVFPGIDPNVAWAAFSRLLPEGVLRAASTANAPAANAGYLYKNAAKKFNIGLAWRSPVDNHLSGKAAFAFTNTGALAPFFPYGRSLGTEFPNQPVKADFAEPGNYQGGVSTTRYFGMLISSDFEFQDYQRFKDLPINFSITQDSQGREIGTPPEKRLEFNFANSYAIHFGVQKPWKWHTEIRAGYMFDHSPVPDSSTGPLFPDSSRNSLTIGATQVRGNLEFSFFYQAMFFLNRTTDVAANDYQYTNGDYRAFAHLAGLSLKMNLGGYGRQTTK